MGQIKKTDKEKLFDTQLGQRVEVHRTIEKGELARHANRKLNELGEQLNPVAGHLKYCGSVAGHIYYNETLNRAFFVSQVNTLNRTNEQLAQAGAKDLLGAMMEFFGRRRPKLRSGF